MTATPVTQAGRALLADWDDRMTTLEAVRSRILAIECEASASATTTLDRDDLLLIRTMLDVAEGNLPPGHMPSRGIVRLGEKVMAALADQPAAGSAEPIRSVHEAWCADAEHRGCVPEDYAPPGASAPAEPRLPSRDELAKAMFLYRTSTNVPLPADFWERQHDTMRTPFLTEADAILAALREGREAREP